MYKRTVLKIVPNGKLKGIHFKLDTILYDLQLGGYVYPMEFNIF